MKTGPMPVSIRIHGAGSGTAALSLDSAILRPAPIPAYRQNAKPGFGTKVAELDLMQPNTNSPIIPLGGGRALAPPDAFGTDWSILDPETRELTALRQGTVKVSVTSESMLPLRSLSTARADGFFFSTG